MIFFLLVISLLLVPQTVFIIAIACKLDEILLEMQRSRIERKS
jgi:hypothetical protein